MNVRLPDAEPKIGPSARLFPGPDGWLLAPEGAAIRREERVAVIADVHLGYEWARASKGDIVPAHSLVETLSKLESLLRRTPIDRLIVAGDLVESSRPCRSTARDVGVLTQWLADRDIELIRIAGNHDERPAAVFSDHVNISEWTIAHGHSKRAERKLMIGHHHPMLRAGGLCAPCFLVGPETIVLPAFSPNAAGVNIASGFLGGFDARLLRCLAGVGVELHDFGPVGALADRLRRIGSGNPSSWKSRQA